MQVHANWETQLLDLAGHAPQPSARPFFSHWAGDAKLQIAYKKAAQITKFHSKSFFAASGLLPEEKRSAVRALYAFCRNVDDIVDEVEAKKDRDFELNYSFRVEAGSAEVVYRATRQRNFEASGYAYLLWKQGVAGLLELLPGGVSRTPNVEPGNQLHRLTHDRWHTSRIVAQGNRFRHELDGEVAPLLVRSEQY